MKIWKLIVAALAFSLACVAFTGCSDDKGDGNAFNSKLVGTWRSTESNIEIISYVFKSNGTFVERYQYYDESKSWPGKYEYDGDYLELYYDDGDYENTYVNWISNNRIELFGMAFARQ